jgi:hypothetical protein
MFKIARWYKNYQAPAVLMIDDLSDAYIDVYPETYKNDWGYLGNHEGSAFHFLEQELLQVYPDIKITFFTPYERHAVLNENCGFTIKKYALGEREDYLSFLKQLILKGHEIAHHGSNHGKYIELSKCTTVNNWVHEWALFTDVEQGTEITKRGITLFKETTDFDIVGGKYCGYIFINNSQEIIDRCNFLYWCENGGYQSDEYYFGNNHIFSFPTTFSGNSFVRLSYYTGDPARDHKKKYMKLLQPFYNLLSHYKLDQLYKQGKIISIQEHISPSTSAGTTQSANIISDILSLKKIFAFLKPLNIWYATCADIATYHSIKKHTTVTWDNTRLILNFNNVKNFANAYLSLTHEDHFILKQSPAVYQSEKNNGLYTVTVPITAGDNTFEYSFGNH